MRQFFTRKIALAALMIAMLGGIVYSQTSVFEIEGILTFRPDTPQVRSVGSVAFLNRLGTGVQGVSWARPVVTAASGSTTLTIRQSGGIAINTGTSATTEFVMPAAATAGAGANYCFVENGNAAGELLVGVATGDNVVGHGFTDTAGTGGITAIATSANFGIKNTAATNVKGDFACLTSDGLLTWVMTSVMGIWATR